MIVFALLILTTGAGVASVATEPDNMVRCVREDVIGSLVQTRRTCHTVGEWRSLRARADDEARRIIQPGDPNGYGGGDSPTSFGRGG